MPWPVNLNFVLARGTHKENKQNLKKLFIIHHTALRSKVKLGGLSWYAVEGVDGVCFLRTNTISNFRSPT